MRRFLEMLPGLLAWGGLLLLTLFSWRLPAVVAIFIILFDVYWLLRTVYFTIHLRTSFQKMRQQLQVNWSDRLKPLRWQQLYHLIILPMCNEPYEIVRETLESLSRLKYPNNKILVVLATEERAGSAAEEVAKKIKDEFQSAFGQLLVTRHPNNLPGEIPGKGSNEAWAAREAQRLILDPQKIPYENVIASVFDVDTQVLPDYLNILTYNFLLAEKPQRSSFQPIPFYTNNIYQAPALARVLSFSSTFWQMMQQAMPEKLVTFSSHSLPFKALVEIGFWQTDVVSEDSRIFWQLYLHYQGDWRVVPLYYPVSMDANADPSFFRTLGNLYKQQRRWAYGAENIAFLLNGFRTASIPLGKKIFWGVHLLEGNLSWATNSLIIFAFGWLPLLLGGQRFNYNLLSANLPKITSWIMLAASLGIAFSALLAIVLLPPKPKWFRPHHYVFYLIQWALLPITLIIFSCLPAMEAQTRLMLGGKFRLGFWLTPKSRAAEPKTNIIKNAVLRIK